MVSASMKMAPSHDRVAFINRDLLIFFLFLLQFAPGALGLVTSQRGAALDYSGSSIDHTETGGSLLWQVTLFVSFANAFFLASLLRVPVRAFALAIGPILPLVVWSLMSVVWSDHPDLTIRRSVRMAIELVTLTYLGLMFRSPDRLIFVLYRLFLLVLALDVAFIAIPSVSNTPLGYAGVHGHKNSAGQFFFLAFPVLVMGFFDRRICRSKLVAVTALLVNVALLVLTRSKTAVGVLALTVPLVVLVDRLAARNFYALVLTPFACIVLGSILALAVSDLSLAAALDFAFGDATLTGRQQIWNYVHARFDGVPWHGVGFGALWQIGPNIVEGLRGYKVNIVVNQAHNGYLDLLAQLGWIGLGMLGFYLVVTFMRIYRAVSAHEDGKVVRFGHVALFWFCGSLIYNVTESSYYRSLSIWFIVVLAGVVCLSYQRRSSRLVRPASRLARRREAARLAGQHR
jgi:exopolysaccharide production protein ExoQ